MGIFMKKTLIGITLLASITTFANARPCKIITETSDYSMGLWGSGRGNDIKKSSQKYAVEVLAQKPDTSLDYDYFVTSDYNEQRFTNMLGVKKVKKIYDVIVVDRSGKELFRTNDEAYRIREGMSRQTFSNHEGNAYRKAIKFIGQNLICE
jgi:hypothetical protein